MATSSDERNLQVRGVEYLRWTLPHVMIVSVPNEQTITTPRLSDRMYDVLRKFGLLEELHQSVDTQRIIAIQNLKRMGMFPGAADMFILWNDGALQIAALETKDQAPQSKNQEKFQSEFEKIGGRYAIWRTLPELQAILESWGLRPNAPAPTGRVPHSRTNMGGAMQLEAAKQFNKMHVQKQPGAGVIQRIAASVAAERERAVPPDAPPPGHPAHGDR